MKIEKKSTSGKQNSFDTSVCNLNQDIEQKSKFYDPNSGKSYLGGACGVSRMDDENNESVHGRVITSSKGEGMSCVVVEIVICSTLRWLGPSQIIS